MPDVRPVEELVHRVAGQVGRVAPILRRMVEDLIVGEEPQDMGPPEPALRAVRILRPVGKRMVDAVGRHPLDRPPLERERPEDGQYVLEPLRRLETLVGQEPVEAQADAQAAGDPLEGEEHPERLPAKGRRGKEQPQVDERNPQQNVPLDPDLRGEVGEINLWFDGGFHDRLRSFP